MPFNLQLEQQEVQVVFNALGTLPFNNVAQLIAKLGTQVQEQQAPPPSSPETEQEPGDTKIPQGA